MRLSRSNQAFVTTGLVVTSIGLVNLFAGQVRTSTVQSIVLLCSGSSIFLIALLNIVAEQISTLYYWYHNPLRRWSNGKASVFNFKG